jgi:hypothetical protein
VAPYDLYITQLTAQIAQVTALVAAMETRAGELGVTITVPFYDFSPTIPPPYPPIVPGPPGPPVEGTLMLSENIANGAMIDIWDDSGTAKLRNADASDGTKLCDGFMLIGGLAGSTGDFYVTGLNTAAILSGGGSLTPGMDYYLDNTNPGTVTLSPPVGVTGCYIQRLGKSMSTTTMTFQPYSPVGPQG